MARGVPERTGLEDLHFHDLRRVRAHAGSITAFRSTPFATGWDVPRSLHTSTDRATTTKTSHDAMRRFDERRGFDEQFEVVALRQNAGEIPTTRSAHH